MKKKFTVSLIAASLLAAQLSTPAHAIVGGIVSLAGGAGVPVMVVGGAITAVGAVMTFSGDRNHNDKEAVGYMIYGLVIGATGLLILDQNGQAVPQFSALDEASAAKVGLTASELESYNSELDEINVVVQSVAEKLSSSENPSLEQSAALWSQYKGLLSEQAYSGLIKVGQAALQ